ncbi:hypothetical protein GGF37_003255 [Kickxella alabastrina]|nr:hypothetical protein GGF37_003255 [Kickxella alabastrina]
MSTHSTFQTLPWSIIGSVVVSHLNTNRSDYESNPRLASAIIHCYHAWRSAFMSKTCANIEIKFSLVHPPVYLFPSWPLALTQPGFSDITHISFGSAVQNTRFIECIRQNSKSLRKLKVSDLNKGNAELLLYNSQGEPVVYPHLESIVYRGTRSAGRIVHFLKLQLLDFDSGYPFDDDVLFRGNSDTLEKLSISIDSEFMDIATRYCIFADTARFARLQSIGEKFDTVTHARTLTPLSDVDAFLSRTMAAATTSSLIVRFEFRGKLPGSTFMSAARTYSMFSTIQIIHIADCALNFADIVTVLQRAPHLRSLNCELSNDAPAIDGKSGTELVNYMYASNGVFGKYFQNLGFHVDAGFRKENVAEIAALLAIACRQFTRCKVGRIYRDELNSEVNKVLEADHYCRYAGLILWFING